MLFNFDWWFGSGYSQQLDEAKLRCARNRFPDADPDKSDSNPEYSEFYVGLETRTVLYLRDGFSYEIKELVKGSNSSYLTFECMPAEDAYRVGCFVVTLPYDDIVRVEVYAVHKAEKPEDMPTIKGFAGVQPSQGPTPKRPDDRSSRREREAPAEAPASHIPGSGID